MDRLRALLRAYGLLVLSASSAGAQGPATGGWHATRAPSLSAEAASARSLLGRPAGESPRQSLILRPRPGARLLEGMRIAPPAAASAGNARLGLGTDSSAPRVVGLDATRRSLAAGLRHRGPGVALMIVGAAGVVTGLLVDESIVTIAGAGVGLYGLYLYVR